MRTYKPYFEPKVKLNYGNVADFHIRKRGRLLTIGERKRNKYEANKRWKANNKDKVKAANKRAWERLKQDFPDRIKAYLKKSYEKHKEKRLQESRDWQDKNIVKVRASSLKYYYKMKELKNKPKCIGCESILKEGEGTVCSWCIFTYPNKYKVYG